MDDNAGKRTLAHICFTAAAIALLSIPETSVRAQERTQERAQDEPLEVQITGSRIRRAQEEGPSPIVSITADDLNARGYNTVTQAVNDLPQNVGGGFDQQNTFGFTPSASAVDLRGFGSGRALVLIDGRRVPVFPLAQNGTDNFVDLSSIPVAAIERIDVVTTGASAVYGSDAVSGVINIILKKRSDNELSLRRSDTTQGGGGQTRGQFAFGHAGPRDSQFLFFGEYYDQSKMMFADRDYSRSDVLGGNANSGTGQGIFSSFGYPGTFLGLDDSVTPAPNCDTSGGSPGIVDGLCRFNRAQYRELYPEMKHFSGTGKFEMPLTDKLTVFARGTYFSSNVKDQIEPVPATSDIVPGTNANNPAGVDGFWFRRMVEFGPRTDDTDNDTYNVVTGLRGEFGPSYNWELGVQYAKQKVKSIEGGYMTTSGLSQAVTTGVVDLNGDGTLDPVNLFEPIPQAVIDAISVTPTIDAMSSIKSVDWQLSGDLFPMPSGPAQFAVYTEYAKEQFEDRRDEATLAGDVEGLGGTSGVGDRKYYALGVELQVPIIKTLSLNLAGRYDKYNDASDVGGAFSPRAALEFRPITQVLLRASAGRSFRAPDLQRLFGGTTAAFEDVIDTPTCIADGGTGRGDPSVPSCVTSVQSIQTATTANRKLSEEKGKNYDIGIVFDPLPGLSISTDFWYIRLNDIVNTPTTQFILDQNAASGANADVIQRDPVGCDASRNPGCLSFVTLQARNLAFQRAEGVDSEIRYALNAGELGAFTFKVGGSYLNKLEIQELPGDEVVNALAAGGVGQFVRFKAIASTGWQRGPWGGTVFVNHIGSFTPTDSTTVSRIGQWTTTNVSGSYALPWKGTIELGVNNLFNKDPPLDLSLGNSSQPFYNQTFHNPYGMTWWAGYTQRF